MQRKTVSKSTAKIADLKARLKPISLEEPLTGSPFLKLIEDESGEQFDPKAESETLEGREAAGKSISAANSESDKSPSLEFEIVQPIKTKTAIAQKQTNQTENENQPPPDNALQSVQLDQKKTVAKDAPERDLPKKIVNAIAPRKLCRLLEIDDLDDIFSVADLLKASSLKLYAALVVLADKNGRLKIKAHELMRAAGIKGIATYYKQERWLTDLGLIEKRAKPGPHEGSSYRIYSLDSLPVSGEIIAEFDRYLRRQSE